METGPLMHHPLEATARRFGTRPAVRAGDRVCSFGDLDFTSSAWAHHLARRGVRPGDRVAVMTTNRIEFVTSVHGISKLGAAAVLLSPAWKDAEVRHAVALTNPTHGVADAAAVGLLAGYVPVTDLDVAEIPDSPDPIPVPIDEGAEAVLVFSSGTTGMPKAVRHTHASIRHATRHWIDALDLSEHDRFQVATPPSHILGLLNLLAAAEAGATVRLHARFDLDEILSGIERERMTLEMAVAPIALAMANHPDLEDYDLSSLRYIVWGATPVTESVAERVTRRTGVRWLPGYGASEVPVIACNPVREPDRWRLDSVGLPVRGIELRVADIDSGKALPATEVGEIQVRSASAMAGYLPEAADDAAFVDGWYRTGDIGWVESDGWVHITDRAKEMIKVRAFQVAPAEIEAVLLSHPGVRDCAVFGVPDERAGEVPFAAVRLESADAATESELEELVARSLATYKQLRRVVFVDEIPRLPSGKALRRELRARFVDVADGPRIDR